MDPKSAARVAEMWGPYVNKAEKLAHVEERGKRAFQFWTDQVKTNKVLDVAAKAKFKAVIADMPKIVAAAKQVQKEILVVTNDISAVKRFDGTPKQFRELIFDKKMPAAKSLEPLADKFLRGITTLTPKGYYPGKAGLAGIGVNPDAMSTVGAVKDFLEAYRLLRAQAVKLT